MQVLHRTNTALADREPAGGIICWKGWNADHDGHLLWETGKKRRSMCWKSVESTVLDPGRAGIETKYPRILGTGAKNPSAHDPLLKILPPKYSHPSRRCRQIVLARSGGELVPLDSHRRIVLARSDSVVAAGGRKMPNRMGWYAIRRGPIHLTELTGVLAHWRVLEEDWRDCRTRSDVVGVWDLERFAFQPPTGFGVRSRLSGTRGRRVVCGWAPEAMTSSLEPQSLGKDREIWWALAISARSEKCGWCEFPVDFRALQMVARNGGQTSRTPPSLSVFILEFEFIIVQIRCLWPLPRKKLLWSE